jgi:hypothetical protein
MSAVVQAFAKAMLVKVNHLKFDLDTMNDEKLLESRKQLVAAVKAGMIERENREEEIAIMAAVVWFRRLTKEEQDRITDLW